MSTWLSGIIGQGIAANLGATGCYSASQQQAQQQAMAAQQAYGVGQQGMSQAYTGSNWQPPKWMFNGVMLGVLDFANEIWPEDCADKTAFVLKYSE